MATVIVRILGTIALLVWVYIDTQSIPLAIVLFLITATLEVYSFLARKILIELKKL